MPQGLDAELAGLATGGRPVCLRRGTDGVLKISGVADNDKEVLASLGITETHPVLVLVGGAGVMDTAVDADSGRLTAQLKRVMDLAVVRSVERAAAVVLTGGTAQGIMRLAGECLRDRGAIALIGVAPRKMVTAELSPRLAPDGLTPLDLNHDGFVLTAGEEWGAETETLFGVAQQIAGSGRAGVVVLANGGAVARQEASRFLEAGWPVITLSGTKRAADDLAHAWDVPRWTHPKRRLRSDELRREWGDLDRAQVEVYHVASEQEEGLSRRLSWHLTSRQLLKNGFSSWAAYDDAASAGRRSTRRIQRLSVCLAALLTVGSLVEGTYSHAGGLKWGLVALPVLLALSGSVGDFVLPRRNWMAMRAAAQAVERAVYRYRARCAVSNIDGLADKNALTALAFVREHFVRSGVRSVIAPGVGRPKKVSSTYDELADKDFVTALDFARERLARGGVRSVVAPGVGRPKKLSNAYDELAELTIREYTVTRLDGQLTYYRDAATDLEHRQLWSLAVSAVLAATATWASSEVLAARWVPLLVLGGAVLVIMQQRARWQDRVALYNAAIADLQGIRDRYSEAQDGDLQNLVNEVENALERESNGWLQSMNQSSGSAPPPFG